MKKSIEVFDFKEEDELAESAAGKLLEKFTNPSPCNSPAPQRQRIQRFGHEKRVKKEELDGASSVEATTVVVDRHCEDATTLVSEAEESNRDHLIETDVDHVDDGLVFGLNTRDDVEETDVDHDDRGLMFCLNTEDGVEETEVDNGLESFSCQPNAKSLYAEISSYSQPHLNSSRSDSSCSEEEEQTDMMSAIDESLSDRSALVQDSDSDSEWDEDWMAEHGFTDMEKIDRNTAVIMTPEYVVLKDMLSAASLVIFSCDGIKVKSYLASNEDEPLSCEFGVEDIVSIQYNWYQNVGLIILKIRVLLKDEKCHEEMQHTTDIEELKLAVKEHNWPEKQQKINSLHVKYPAVWNTDLGDDMEVSGHSLHQQRRYFPRFDEPFEDVVYPKGDPDAVSICNRDVELLQPETFVNDTIIDFYINYLKNQIQAEEKHRFHFFNSFFFRKLADLDKDPSSIADGKAAFLRVRKWTRKVDMFGKDYIFVPVNFNLHWSLIVICHPGEVSNCTDLLDFDDSTKVPCILHMDSIKGSHAGLKNLVQSYLCEEWKERHKDASDDISSRFMNLRFVSLELPQQENSYDCGLFLLHYLELFLAEAPDNFSPFNIYNASNFLYLNWFPPAEASLKRTLIQKLIFELLENRSREVSDQQNQSCESPVAVNNDTGIEVLSERCSPLVDCNGNMTQTQDDQGIEMTLLERSSMRNVQVTNDSSMVLRDLFDSGVNNTGSLLGQLQQTFDEPSTTFYNLSNDSLSREQVDMETGEQFMCLNTGDGNFQRITGTESPRASTSFASWDLSMMPMQKEGEADSLSDIPKDTTNDSEDIGIIEDNPMESIHEGETGESPPKETISLFSATVASISDHNTENEELVSTHVELVVPSTQDDEEKEKPLENDLEVEDKPSNPDLETGADNLEVGDKASNCDTTGEDPEDGCDQKEKEPTEEEDENRAAKRPRLSSTGEV